MIKVTMEKGLDIETEDFSVFAKKAKIIWMKQVVKNQKKSLVGTALDTILPYDLDSDETTRAGNMKTT